MRAVVVFAVFTGVSIGASASAIEPTAFERFATSADTAILESREIGSLTSADATAAITALLGAARDDPDRRMRGVHVELSNNGGSEHVYLERSQLERLLEELDLMELSRVGAVQAAQSATRGNRVQGTESCWMPRLVVRILCPEIVERPAWSGLRLFSLGGTTFEFRDRTSTELRTLVERAVTELNGL